MSSTTMQDRYKGAMLGLATGDALGTTLEFEAPGSFMPIDDMVGGGPFNLPVGAWTDDTSMALCLAESLIECNGFDAADQMRRYVRWYRDGYWSSTGHCFDIGNTTRASLERFQENPDEPYQGPTSSFQSGNGSLMRLAPVPLFFAPDAAAAIEHAALSSRTTHGSDAAVDACRYFAGLLIGALRGEPKEALLSPFYSPIPGYWDRHPLSDEIAAVAAGSFLHSEPPVISGAGHVVRSLEAALWALRDATDFREGALRVVNLGDDADTTGAIYGQIAGAYFGASGIPAAWVETLTYRAAIERMAIELLDRSGHA
jgi:ADP-ribosylglycohydrolase